MRCPICNSEDDGISIDPHTGKFGDCYTCEEAIFDCISGYPNLPDPAGVPSEIVRD